MIVRSIKKDDGGKNEWVFGQGYTSYKKNEAQIEQDIYTALYEFKYNAFWALENGIDWFTRLGYKNQKLLLDNDIINCIKNREGVLSITDFVSNVADRAYTCSCNVYTIFSESPLNINFGKEI